MEKRVLLAIVLSIAVMYGYTMIFPQPKPTAPVPKPGQGEIKPAVVAATPPAD